MLDSKLKHLPHFVGLIFLLTAACSYAQSTSTSIAISDFGFGDNQSENDARAGSSTADDSAYNLEDAGYVIDLSGNQWGLTDKISPEQLTTATSKLRDSFSSLCKLPLKIDHLNSGTPVFLATKLHCPAGFERRNTLCLTVGEVVGKCRAWLDGVELKSERGYANPNENLDDQRLFLTYVFTISEPITSQSMLALSLENDSHTSEVAIYSPAVHIRPMPSLPMPTRRYFDEVTSGELGLNTELPMKLIKLIEQDTSGTESIAKVSYGRYLPKSFRASLPAVESISPTKMQNTFSPSLTVQLDGVDSVVHGKRYSGQFTNEWQVNGRIREKSLQYTVISNDQYPGAVIELPPKTHLPMRIKFMSKHGIVQKVDADVLSSVLGQQSKNSECSSLIVAEATAQSGPIFILLSEVNYNLTRAGDSADISFKTGDTLNGYVHIIFPFGKGGRNLTSNPDNLSRFFESIAPGVEKETVLKDWLSLSVNVPLYQNEYYMIMSTPDAGRFVRAYLSTQYVKLSSLSAPLPATWLPPVYKSDTGVVLRLPDFVESNIETQYGKIGLVNNCATEESVRVYSMDFQCELASSPIPLIHRQKFGNESNVDAVISTQFVSDVSEQKNLEKKISLQFQALKTALANNNVSSSELDYLDALRCIERTVASGQWWYSLNLWSKYSGKWSWVNAELDNIKRADLELLAANDAAGFRAINNAGCLDNLANATVLRRLAFKTKNADLEALAYFMQCKFAARLGNGLLQTLESTVATASDSNSDFTAFVNLQGYFVAESWLLMINKHAKMLNDRLIIRRPASTDEKLFASLLRLQSGLTSVIDEFGKLGGDGSLKTISPSQKANYIAGALTISSDVNVIDLGRAAVLNSQVSQGKDGNEYLIKIDCFEEDNTVKIQMPTRPLKLSVNRHQVPLTYWDYSAGYLTIKMKSKGTNEILFNL